MNIWKEKMSTKHGNEMKKRLTLIGETRWSSKYDCLKKIFGSFSSETNGLFSEIVQVFKAASECENLTASSCLDAESLFKKLIDYKIILTAFTYLRILEKTSPLSKYLQTSGLDFVKAFNMVEATIKDIKKISRDFGAVVEKTNDFIKNANTSLLDCGIAISNEMSYSRGCVEVDPMEKFKIDAHNTIMDKILTSLSSRFSLHEQLYKDLCCLDPKRFKDLLRNGVPASAMKALCALMSRDPSVQAVAQHNLKTELLDFAAKWPGLRKDFLLDNNEPDLDETEKGETTNLFFI